MGPTTTTYFISRPTETDRLWHVRREGQEAMSFTERSTALQWATSHARAHAALHGVACRVLVQNEEDEWQPVAE